MNRIFLTRLLLAASFSAASGVALAQGTTPGTTPTNPAPETMGTTQGKASAAKADGMSTGADSLPTKAECDKMMMDHKKNPSSSGSMNTTMDAQKMKQCEAMKPKVN